MSMFNFPYVKDKLNTNDRKGKSTLKSIHFHIYYFILPIIKISMLMHRYLIYECFRLKIFHSAQGKISIFIQFLINLPQLKLAVPIFDGYTNETYC